MGRSPTPPTYPDVELDLGRYELRVNGRRAHLERLPMELLILLHERQPQLVTRDEIVARLWGEKVFLDARQGINSAIGKIRRALNDDPERPRHIETVVGKGYRLISPIRVIPLEVADRPANLPGPGTEDSSGQKTAYNHSGRLESWKEIATYLKREVRTVQRWEKREDLPVHRHQHEGGPTVFAYEAELDAWLQQGAIRPRRNRRLWLAAAGVALMAAAATIYVLKFRASPQLSLQPKDPILIAEFQNRTGDPVFDGTLRQGLAAQLAQSPFLHIVSDQRIAGELRLMRQPAGARLSSDVTRQVCERMGGVAVLGGSITKIDTEYSLVLDAMSCSTGASLARAEAVAIDKNHVLDALGTVATSMRRRLGESLASIRKFNKPLAEVTTPSLEALKAYSLGSSALMATNYDAAAASFRHAVSLDPNFAIAYAKLGAASENGGNSILAMRYLKKAYALRDRVSEKERFYVSSHYFNVGTGDLQKANQIYELWARTYPRDVIPVASMGHLFLALGQYDKALTMLRRSLEMAPTEGILYANFARCYMALDRLDMVTATIGKVMALGIDSPDFHFQAYEVAFLRGDKAGMARGVAWADKPGVDQIFHDFLVQSQAEAAASAGQLSQANDLSGRAATRIQRAGNKARASLFLAIDALREATVGNTSLARRQARDSLGISKSRYGEATATIALGLAGDAAQARQLADDLAKRFPRDTILQFNYLPTIRAAIALAESNPPKAVADLQEAAPYELGFTGNFVNLYPVYVRGLAFLAEHKGPQAAAEFQKILDHPGIALAEIIVPLSRLGLARARALEGDKSGARKAYKDFLALWQHADPGIPILKRAKAEYAKLQ